MTGEPEPLPGLEDLRALLEAAGLGTCRIGSDGRILTANGAFACLLGMPSAEAVRSVPPGAFYGEAPDPLSWARRQPGTGARQREVDLRRADGTTLAVRETIVPCEASDGGLGGVDVALFDVKDERRLQDELRSSRKVEALGRVAGGLAHDFNNLLTAILGYGQLVLARAGEDVDLRRDVTEMCRAAERAAALTRQLLAFGRPGSVRPRPLDVEAVLEDLEGLLRSLISEDVTVLRQLQGGLPAIYLDPSQLEQVVVNLVLNARDAMPGGGRLTLRTAAVTGGGTASGDVPPGRWVALSVSDTGVGMDAGTRARMFEPFFTTKTDGHGNGLGLSVVRAVVTQGGGHIRVSTGPVEGTTVTVLLPALDDAPLPAAQAAPAREMAKGRGTVLLAEDDARVRDVARLVLEAAGFAVLAAPHGDAALEAARDHPGPIHLFLTDVVMPGIPGPELARRVLAMRGPVAVVYMSGYAGADDGPPPAVRPGEAFLPKPFTPAQLVQLLRDVLDAR